LGVVYLLFLALGTWLIFAFDGPMVFLLILLGVGAFGIILYITTNVTVSNDEILARTLFGEKTIKWSEIGSFKSTRNSLKLMNADGDTTIRINSRLDGYIAILYMLYRLRDNLFDTSSLKAFSKNKTKLLINLLVYILVFAFVIIRYIFSGDWESILWGIGLGAAIFYSLYSMLFLPQVMILESDTIFLKYLTKTTSISRNDIASILSNGNQVSIILREGTQISVSDFEQGPFVVYSTLMRWHEPSHAKQTGFSG